MYPSSSKQSGMTLIEMLIAMGVMVVAVPAVLAFVWGAFNLSTYVTGATYNQQLTRRVVGQMMEELREVHISDSNTDALEVCTPSEIIFYSDNDGDVGHERIRYTLDGVDLIRGVIQPVDSGGVVSYPAENETETTLVTYVRNSAEGVDIFSFYNEEYFGELDGILSGTVNCAEVRIIGISLMIDSQVEALPDSSELHSKVMLRNLKPNS